MTKRRLICHDNIMHVVLLFHTVTNPSTKTKICAKVLLEYGLAQHHFEQPGMGRACFQKAKEQSGLAVFVTGSSGKRTKLQTKYTAQMMVEAASASMPEDSQQEGCLCDRFLREAHQVSDQEYSAHAGGSCLGIHARG
jgi:hypothetical protein